MVQTVWPNDPNCTAKPIKPQEEEKKISHLETEKSTLLNSHTITSKLLYVYLIEIFEDANLVWKKKISLNQRVW